MARALPQTGPSEGIRGHSATTNIAPYALERDLARHECSARNLLSTSDGEPLTLTGLLAPADPKAVRQHANQP